MKKDIFKREVCDTVRHLHTSYRNRRPCFSIPVTQKADVKRVIMIGNSQR